MLDEMANDIDANGFNGDNVGWYTSLTDYIKNTKGLSFVQGNPGTNTVEEYIGSVDQIKVYESTGLPILANLFNDWKLNYPISNFGFIPHTVSTDTQTIIDYVIESQQYMSHIYIQDDGADGNPWDTLSSYYETIVMTQAMGNLGGTSVTSTEASETTQTPPPPPTGTNISTCQTLDIPGETYVLTSDITTSGDCLLITADGITLDGNGYNITGDGTGIGVDIISSTGVTVKNLNVSNFNFGIYIGSSNGNTITNNTISNITQYALNLYGSSNNLVSSNYISFSDNGIHIDESSSMGNTFTLNTLYQNGHEQMHFHTTNDNNLVYHNNFLEPTAVQINDECGGCDNLFFIGTGGNYYSDYDEPSEGCNDVNSDGFCDDPFLIQSTGPFIPDNNQDDLPFTVQNGWDLSAPGDTTPPVVTVPSDMTVGATDASGAVVTFTASATDDLDGTLTPTCTPPSGSTFPIGTITVTCEATDTAGNTGSASFDITVLTAGTGPTTPVLDSAVLVGSSYILDWTLPSTTLGTPDGGYDIIIDIVDTDETYRTTELHAEIEGLDTSIEHCFNIQARWLQESPPVNPVSNVICVPPL